jgi:hypothetical protein
MQLPSPPLNAELQLSTPSLTVTLPVGAPVAAVTVKLTVTTPPGSDGSGLSPVTTVVVAAGAGGGGGGGGVATTVTCFEMLPVALRSSVTTSVTVYAPPDA